MHKLFEILARVSNALAQKLKVIVLNHAADTWGDIPGVYLVEEWRGDTKLAPEAWLHETAQQP